MRQIEIENYRKWASNIKMKAARVNEIVLIAVQTKTSVVLMLVTRPTEVTVALQDS